MNDHKIHIAHNWGVFVGHITDNHPHRHYAIQIGVSAGDAFAVSTTAEGAGRRMADCYIHTNVTHRIVSHGKVLILLINPLSALGYQFSDRYKATSPITELEVGLKNELSTLLGQFLANEIDFAVFKEEINHCLNKEAQEVVRGDIGDKRIQEALHYLDDHVDEVVSLKEIADFCCLSETRFLHLFKEKTRLNFRRYQLWNRLIQSMGNLRHHSITTTAHKFGFTDSAHYSRTFRETFGLKPSQFLP